MLARKLVLEACTDIKAAVSDSNPHHFRGYESKAEKPKALLQQSCAKFPQTHLLSQLAIAADC